MLPWHHTPDGGCLVPRSRPGPRESVTYSSSPSRWSLRTSRLRHSSTVVFLPKRCQFPDPTPPIGIFLLSFLPKSLGKFTECRLMLAPSAYAYRPMGFRVTRRGCTYLPVSPLPRRGSEAPSTDILLLRLVFR